MKRLIARDEFIAESEPRHQATFLHPVNRAECAREENPFDARKRHEARLEGAAFIADPFQRPIRLLLDTRERLDGIE